ncbi:beta-propeller fold lactonase family protein [Sodalis sp. dw_96]|uniref:lactonase family protein n=1 Tax=Sodalis sp. dw_96 TaxID=2719794 RepID=UPI002104A9A7|nr:beta-propeller fold lactonase family protein [Sodalis sp. dw_96]
MNFAYSSVIMTKTLMSKPTVAALIVGMAGVFSSPSLHADTFVYVSNALDGTISDYRLDTQKGALTFLRNTPAGQLVMPMAVSPDKKHLYAAVRSKPYSVVTYRIDGGSGFLDRIATAPLSASMAYISTDRRGNYLFGASFDGDVVAVSPISPQGVAAGKTLQTIKTGPHAHSVISDVTNRFVYVGNLGVDRVLQFAFDERSGQLTPIGSGFVQAPTGSGPRHSTVSPDGNNLYSLSELTGTVTRYAIDRTDGNLTRQEIIEGVPGKYHLQKGLVRPALGQGEKIDDTPRIWAADIKITPDGRFLYTTERTSSTVTAYRVAIDSGKLSYINTFDVEKQPRGIAIDPRGRWLVVSGEKSATIGVYGIDAQLGSLTRAGEAPAGKDANWVEIVEQN